ncbi:Imm61 family immunity protein [Leifsonia xyli]|uniref:Imm61 family immunity protein n=1 Tax=Leifsonia xyli TaxID=1575 RepID=UPI003D6660C6
MGLLDLRGEVRNFLRIIEDRFVFTEAYRSNDDDSLLFSTPLLSDMERFLIFYMCNRIRYGRNLPRLLVVTIPVTNDKVAPGFTITKASGPGYELRHANEPEVRYGDDVQLVKFSHYVSLNPDEIRESALDPEGKPHFMVAV